MRGSINVPRRMCCSWPEIAYHLPNLFGIRDYSVVLHESSESKFMTSMLPLTHIYSPIEPFSGECSFKYCYQAPPSSSGIGTRRLLSLVFRCWIRGRVLYKSSFSSSFALTRRPILGSPSSSGALSFQLWTVHVPVAMPHPFHDVAMDASA